MITPKKLHEWYLEACKELSPENFNTDAQKPYEELSEEQKFIDIYIAEKIKRKLKKEIEKFEKEDELYKQLKRDTKIFNRDEVIKATIIMTIDKLKQNLGIEDDCNKRT